MILTNNPLAQTEWLLDFHAAARKEGPWGRMALLQFASKQNGHPGWSRTPQARLEQLRYQFITDHVKRRRYPRSSVCFACHYPIDKYYFARHHILALSRWGNNRRLNVVTVCEPCHEEIHPWLLKARLSGRMN
jgi:5-methylcytosine-specific restriction endonuclease McrA